MERYRDNWMKIVVGSAKTLQCLVWLQAKPCSPSKKLLPTWLETRSDVQGRSLTAPPPPRWVYQVDAHSPASNELSSPVNPKAE
jgi:hypothetical protein